MAYFADRFFGWMDYEPLIGLLMVVATIALFLGAWRRARPSDTFWGWMRTVIECAGVAVLFLGMLWAFRAILNDNTRSFRATHGRVSQTNYESVATIWGGPIAQRELQVRHTVEVEEKEEIPRPDPALPPVYKTVRVLREVEQNSLLSSKGTIDVTPNRRKKGSAFYNGFDLAFAVEYRVVNDAKSDTRAQFTFPLSDGQAIVEGLLVTEDGKDISRDLRIDASSIRWSRVMKAGEQRTVAITYRSRGMEHVYYQIPYAREIRDFSLVLTATELPTSEVNYPEGCLTPSAVKPTADGRGSILSWTLDRSVTTAGMGLALPKPEQPGEKVLLVLERSPYSLMLLVVSVCLTLLVLGRRIDFLETSLLSAVYCLLFFVMAATSDYLLGFWGSLVPGAALTVGLAALLFRREERRVRIPALALVLFFTAVYPVVGLVPDFEQPFDAMVSIGLVVYLFFLVLSTRIRPGTQSVPTPV